MSWLHNTVDLFAPVLAGVRRAVARMLRSIFPVGIVHPYVSLTGTPPPGEIQPCVMHDASEDVPSLPLGRAHRKPSALVALQEKVLAARDDPDTGSFAPSGISQRPVTPDHGLAFSPASERRNRDDRSREGFHRRYQRGMSIG